MSVNDFHYLISQKPTENKEGQRKVEIDLGEQMKDNQHISYQLYSFYHYLSKSSH